MSVKVIWDQCLLGFLGLSSGLSVAGGVFTVFTAVGLVPRFAEHTKSSDHIVTYENMIILGCFLGTLYSLFSGLTPPVAFGKELACFVLGFVGLFTGVYVGTLAVSIAELLDAIPIMAHRINIKRGVSLVIAGLAIGKLIGSLFYYMNGVYDW